MPLIKQGSKWKWGKSGKLYTNKADALRQMRAILATGWREKPKAKGK